LEVSTAHQATAVALRFGSTLVTLDREQRERVAGVVPSRLPAGALAEWA
jgi:predicted nucleic acid-binding protein